jgi:cytochrome d ubiquinol oxidase subunit II
LWSDFRAGSHAGILDWYTILTGVAALLALTMHGALWVRMKSPAPICERAALLARRAWWGVVAATVAITVASFAIQPHLSERFAEAPWGYVVPAFALAGLLGVFLCNTPQTEALAFFSSCGYLIGMLTSAAFGVYPLLLPASTDPALSVTIHNAAAGSYGLSIGLAWWLPGMLLACGYAIFTYRRFSGKVSSGIPPEAG